MHAPDLLARLRSAAAFHASTFAWNFTLGMTYLLIPLYANELGMSGVAIGSLISLPVLIQVWFSLLGGAYTDRIGARLTSQAASLFSLGAALIFAASASFTGLLAGQALMILSRATFWPACWALASQLSGDRSRNMGAMNAISSIGQILALAVTGVVISRWGFRAGFWLMAASSAAALALAALVEHGRVTRAERPGSLLTGYRALLRRRPIYLAMVCAYISALPFSLSLSFLPILMAEHGFAPDANGWLLALRAVGSVVAGAFLARLVRGADHRGAPLFAALLSAASVGLVALYSYPVWVGLCLITIGLGSGIMTMYFQTLISSASSIEQRGSAMALGGVGWGTSHLSTPLIVGAFKDLFGIHVAFYLLAAVVFASALAFVPVHRWAMAGRSR